EIVLGMSGFALVVLLPIQWLRRGAKQRGAGNAADAGAGRTLRCIETLFDALAERGEVRQASESLEHFARRLLASDAFPEAASAAELLLRYAALRYGGEGDAAELTRDVDGWIRVLADVRPSRSRRDGGEARTA